MLRIVSRILLDLEKANVYNEVLFHNPRCWGFARVTKEKGRAGTGRNWAGFVPPGAMNFSECGLHTGEVSSDPAKPWPSHQHGLMLPLAHSKNAGGTEGLGLQLTAASL